MNAADNTPQFAGYERPDSAGFINTTITPSTIQNGRGLQCTGGGGTPVGDGENTMLCNADYYQLKTCIGEKDDNGKNTCYISVLELANGGAVGGKFPAGEFNSKQQKILRAPTLTMAKALFFQVLYAHAYAFKTIGFQNWDLKWANLMIRKWPKEDPGKICYVLWQAHSQTSTTSENVLCIPKEQLTFDTGAPSTVKDKQAAVDVILMDFDASSAGCGECQDCGTCGPLERVASDMTRWDYEALIALWYDIRPCGLKVTDGLDKYGEVARISGADPRHGCNNNLPDVPVTAAEIDMIKTIGELSKDSTLHPQSHAAISEQAYQELVAGYGHVISHSFFQDEAEFSKACEVECTGPTSSVGCCIRRGPGVVESHSPMA